jgi:putative membrane protein
MTLQKWMTTAALAAALLACRGETQNTSGLPESDTSGSIQSAQQTSSATATTTGSTGGGVSNLSDEDKGFVTNAGMSGLAEVQMGNLALQKAQSAEVKAYAQRMVTDHAKGNEELSQLATVKGLALPAELDAEHKAGMDHLNSLSGAEFDKAYMQHMIPDHEKAVAEFDKASTSATDADIKAWAGKTLPTLQEHLAAAKEIARKQ